LISSFNYSLHLTIVPSRIAQSGKSAKDPGLRFAYPGYLKPYTLLCFFHHTLIALTLYYIYNVGNENNFVRNLITAQYKYDERRKIMQDEREKKLKDEYIVLNVSLEGNRLSYDWEPANNLLPQWREHSTNDLSKDEYVLVNVSLEGNILSWDWEPANQLSPERHESNSNHTSSRTPPDHQSPDNRRDTPTPAPHKRKFRDEKHKSYSSDDSNENRGNNFSGDLKEEHPPYNPSSPYITERKKRVREVDQTAQNHDSKRLRVDHPKEKSSRNKVRSDKDITDFILSFARYYNNDRNSAIFNKFRNVTEFDDYQNILFNMEQKYRNIGNLAIAITGLLRTNFTLAKSFYKQLKEKDLLSLITIKTYLEYAVKDRQNISFACEILASVHKFNRARQIKINDCYYAALNTIIITLHQFDTNESIKDVKTLLTSLTENKDYDNEKNVIKTYYIPEIYVDLLRCCDTAFDRMPHKTRETQSALYAIVKYIYSLAKKDKMLTPGSVNYLMHFALEAKEKSLAKSAFEEYITITLKNSFSEHMGNPTRKYLDLCIEENTYTPTAKTVFFNTFEQSSRVEIKHQDIIGEAYLKLCQITDNMEALEDAYSELKRKSRLTYKQFTVYISALCSHIQEDKIPDRIQTAFEKFKEIDPKSFQPAIFEDVLRSLLNQNFTSRLIFYWKMAKQYKQNISLNIAVESLQQYGKENTRENIYDATTIYLYVTKLYPNNKLLLDLHPDKIKMIQKAQTPPAASETLLVQTNTPMIVEAEVKKNPSPEIIYHEIQTPTPTPVRPTTTTPITHPSTPFSPFPGLPGNDLPDFIIPAPNSSMVPTSDNPPEISPLPEKIPLTNKPKKSKKKPHPKKISDTNNAADSPQKSKETLDTISSEFLQIISALVPIMKNLFQKRLEANNPENHVKLELIKLDIAALEKEELAQIGNIKKYIKTHSVLKNNINSTITHNNAFYTPITYCTRTGSLKAVTMLAEEFHARLSTPGSVSRKPIHIASEYGWADIVQYIINKQPKQKDTVTGSGETPYYIAQFFGRKNVMDVLIKHNADSTKTPYSKKHANRTDIFDSESNNVSTEHKNLSNSMEAAQNTFIPPVPIENTNPYLESQNNYLYGSYYQNPPPYSHTRYIPQQQLLVQQNIPLIQSYPGNNTFLPYSSNIPFNPPFAIQPPNNANLMQQNNGYSSHTHSSIGSDQQRISPGMQAGLTTFTIPTPQPAQIPQPLLTQTTFPTPTSTPFLNGNGPHVSNYSPAFHSYSSPTKPIQGTPSSTASTSTPATTTTQTAENAENNDFFNFNDDDNFFNL
jgi:hypothetical protein